MIRQKKTLAVAIVGLILLVALISAATASIGRFTPTHAIVEPVYCGACHPEQVEELTATTHLLHFANAVGEIAEENGATITMAQAISGGCQMCHNAWDNRELFGVANYTYDPDNFSAKWESVDTGGVENTVFYWTNDSNEYTEDGATYTRLDRIWGDLSSTSPNPQIAFKLFNGSNTSQSLASCGTVEKGMCHSVESAVGMSEAGLKRESPAGSGNTNYYTHEMSYTTADYVGKQVKYCAVCHINKLPPMYDNGTAMPATGGELSIIYSSHSVDHQFNATWQSNEFAHKNVQCIRCHSHAGINNIGTGVSSNEYN